MRPVNLNEIIILTVHTFIPELLPVGVGVAVTVGGVTVSVIRKGLVISKIGNSKNT